MVEQHVGKKRRKEVRQAITLRDEMRGSLRFALIVLGIAAVIIIAFYVLISMNYIDQSGPLSQFGPLSVMVIAVIISLPKAARFWAVRDKYKNHLHRYNISKEDMTALEAKH